MGAGQSAVRLWLKPAIRWPALLAVFFAGYALLATGHRAAFDSTFHAIIPIGALGVLLAVYNVRKVVRATLATRDPRV